MEAWLLNSFWGDEVDGDFALSTQESPPYVGDRLFCIWIAPDEYTQVTPVQQVTSFRPPTGTVTASLASQVIALGQPISVTVSGASEGEQLDVVARVSPGVGEDCPATPGYAGTASPSRTMETYCRRSRSRAL